MIGRFRTARPGGSLSQADLCRDELVDALLGDSPRCTSRTEAFEMLRDDPDRRDEVLDTLAMVADLRHHAGAPDLTNSILNETHRRRGFLSPGMMRWIRGARTGVALLLIGALIGLALGRRMAPERMSITNAQTPVSSVQEAVQADAIAARSGMAHGLGQVQNMLIPGHAEVCVDQTIRASRALLGREMILVLHGDALGSRSDPGSTSPSVRHVSLHVQTSGVEGWSMISGRTVPAHLRESLVASPLDRSRIEIELDEILLDAEGIDVNAVD